ncbi:MAG: alpha/beta fold hydrolase [Bacteroidetes bacterium]|jgi:dipeptidyl aminopeptidase/acylaminoacyl peptidase|nr:alpha/beta fold hydrolase [Bacteroidota bacterium]
MKPYLLLIASIALLLSSCQSTPDEAAKGGEELQQYTIEQFMGNTSYRGGAFSPDERTLLVTSDASGIFNAYAIPVVGGEPTALTQSDSSSVYAISYFPEDERVLFRMDDNGNEIFHLFVQGLDGQVTALTPDSSARASFYGWARDEKSFYYGYTKRNPRLTDIYEMDIETMTPKMIYQNDEAYSFGGISGDEQYMVLINPINTNDNELFLYSFADESMAKISEEQAKYLPADFSVDSKSLYYLTDAGAEFQYLMRYDIATGEREKILEADWDISYAYFSRDGKYRVVGINQDGQTVVEVTDVESGKAVDFPAFENGNITSVNISDSEELMRFYVGSSSSPSNLHVYNFESGEHRQLTDALNPEIDQDDLVTAEVVRYESFDGLEIPAIYYKPHQASPDNPVPALVWVHGGPGGQSRQTYRPLIQYLANHGYAVLAVNNRGSSGYGKTFYRMDDRRHGEEDLKDCVWGKKWLAEQTYIDSTKIGIIGGSYGGFMVMAALTRTPEAFDVGVDIFGVTNWLRTLKSIPPWWESFKDALYQEMGDPAQDSVRLYNISPLFHADKITKPVMVLQGAQDPRVLKVESDEIVAAVKENDVPVEYVVFEDEGHGFVKKENQIEAYGKILDFLDKYLKKEEEEELKG